MTQDSATVDVGSQQAARVYASALLETAAERDQEDEIRDELNGIVGDVFRESPALEEFFSTTAIGQGKKEDLIRQTFGDRSSETMTNFLLVLNRQNRLGLLRPVARTYTSLLAERRKQIAVKVVSATALSDEQAETLRTTIREILKQEPELDQQTDPNLIGGLVIQVGDFRFDASVLDRVNNIRKRLIERSSHVTQIGRDHPAD